MVLQRRFATWLHSTSRHIVLTAMADEVETLKRELEALKLQLENERKKNCTIQSGVGSSEQKSPERPPPRVEPKRGDNTKTASASKEPRSYVRHAAVGARQGKWWLRDRQVLSRATPVAEDGGATLKVRETWIWSGRTVILDKIVHVEEEKDQAHDEVEEEAVEYEPEGADTGNALVENDPAVGAASLSDAATELQLSEVVETNREVDEKTVEKVADALPPQPKAEDEVRESSGTELPVIDNMAT